ncbi:MAG: hypothetical protein AABN34_17495 [Acidobacteriota bacterium]
MRNRIDVLAIVALAALGLILAPASLPTTRAQATNPPYPSQFPSVERVKAEIKGTDPMDTAARQMGAFWQLQQVIKELSGLRWTRNELTPDEKRLLGGYSGGYQSAGQPYASYPDKPKWYKMHAFYETDEAFLDSLFERFLSPALRTQYLNTESQTRARVQAGREQRANTPDKRANTPDGGRRAAAPTNPCPVTDQPKTTKPGVRPNSTLSVIGIPYIHTVTNLDTGKVVSQTRENFTNATFYLLDDDAENVLQSAGIGPGLMGDRFANLAFIGGVAQGDKMPLIGGLLSLPAGQGPAVMVSEAKADLECVMKAIRAHSAAEMTTDANARGTFPSVAAGTYYLYGWYYRVQKPVRQGPVAWNLKVELKPGPNTLRLNVKDAVYAP